MGVEAREKVFTIANIGKKTAKEFIHIVETTIKEKPLDSEKYEKRTDLIKVVSSKYPGVFDPLINEYMGASINDRLTHEKLEQVLNNLCDIDSDHSEMIWFRFSGETLSAIGKRFGVTRERVRQITGRYKEYIANTNSSVWAKKSLMFLIEKYNGGNSLPDNETIIEYHPKLKYSVIKNFSTSKWGKLTPEVRIVDPEKALK